MSDLLDSALSQSLLPDHLDIWQHTLNWQPTPAQYAQFQQLWTALCQLNAKVNLTRITSADEFWEKHLWDSLWGIQPWLEGSPQALRTIDIGTGGGFPGFPAAIAQPDWSITLLDATRKKVACLETLRDELGLGQVRTLCDRAELVGRGLKERGSYDLALIRAVGPAASCAEYALPLLKVGGTAVLYRGQWTEAEAQGLQKALQQLGGKLVEVRSTLTPLTQGQRHCLSLRKVRETPASFPRKVGVPAHSPLGS